MALKSPIISQGIGWVGEKAFNPSHRDIRFDLSGLPYTKNMRNYLLGIKLSTPKEINCG